MNLKRTAAIVVVGAAFAAWISAAMTPAGGTHTPLVSSAPTPADLRGATLASEIARLHERLRPEVAVRQPGRNLFAFHAPLYTAAPVKGAPERAELAPAGTLAPAQPALTLVGIAEDGPAAGTPGGAADSTGSSAGGSAGNSIVRTAIISGGGQLFLVKEGERVASIYRVEKVSADVVELADSRDGSTRRLALR